MVMVFSFERTGWFGDTYLVLSAKGVHPGACIRCGSGELLFYRPQLMFQG